MKPLIGLSAIRARVNKLAALIDAEPDRLPSYGATRDFGFPHIEVDTQYHRVVIERGQEIDRKSTSDLDELLFWVFRGVTFGMSSEFEMHHRRVGEDSRRQLFAKQIELMAILSLEWSNRLRDQIRLTMRSFPFNDSIDMIS